MTLFWIAAGLLTALALAALLVPLLKRRPALAPRADYDLAIYRDQLHELESDRARGLVEDAAYAGARTEIERRMLNAARAEEGAASSGLSPAPRRRWRDRIAAAVIVVGLPVGALALYGALGSPGVPDQPLDERALQEPGADRELEKLIAALEQRLVERPDDAAGWRLLGRSYLLARRAEDAVAAFRRAQSLAGGDSKLASELAEALVFQADGIVTPEAESLFNDAHRTNPDDAAATFYLGLARAQQGEPGAALALWQPLYRNAPEDAPWREELYGLMVGAAKEAGVEPPEPLASSAEAGADAAQEAAGTSVAERQEMIEGMVEGLAARLAKSPDDVPGWLELARSYDVLGEKDKALAAYREAALRAPEDASALAPYAQALVERAGKDRPLPAEAVRLYEKIRSLEPANPEALWFLAEAAAQTGDTPQAIALLEELEGRLRPGTEGRELVAARLKTLRAAR